MFTLFGNTIHRPQQPDLSDQMDLTLESESGLGSSSHDAASNPYDPEYNIFNDPLFLKALNDLESSVTIAGLDTYLSLLHTTCILN